MAGVETLPENLLIDLSGHSSNFEELHFRSSPIDLIMHDKSRVYAGQMILVIKFKKGPYYAYSGVTSPLIDACMKGSRQLDLDTEATFGQALRQEVLEKKDLYPYTRLSADDVEAILGD